jgi:hypothetical protein
MSVCAHELRPGTAALRAWVAGFVCRITFICEKKKTGVRLRVTRYANFFSNGLSLGGCGFRLQRVLGDFDQLAKRAVVRSSEVGKSLAVKCYLRSL